MPQKFLAQLKSPPSPTVLKGPPLNKQYPPSRGFENKTERSVTLHRLPTCGVPRLYRHWRHSCRCHMILGRLHHVRVVLRSLVTGELPLRLPCAFTGVVITSVRSGKQQQTTKEWVAGDCIEWDKCQLMDIHCLQCTLARAQARWEQSEHFQGWDGELSHPSDKMMTSLSDMNQFPGRYTSDQAWEEVLKSVMQPKWTQRFCWTFVVAVTVVLCCAVLWCGVLYCAVLCRAVLCRVVSCCAVLSFHCHFVHVISFPLITWGILDHTDTVINVIHSTHNHLSQQQPQLRKNKNCSHILRRTASVSAEKHLSALLS